MAGFFTQHVTDLVSDWTGVKEAQGSLTGNCEFVGENPATFGLAVGQFPTLVMATMICYGAEVLIGGVALLLAGRVAYNRWQKQGAPEDHSDPSSPRPS